MIIKHSEIWNDPEQQNAEMDNKDIVSENSENMKVSQDSFNPFKNSDFMFDTQKCDFQELQL